MNLGRGASAASNNDPSLDTASTELSEIKQAGAREEIHSLNMFTISFFCLSSEPNIVLGPGRSCAIEIFTEVIRERKLPCGRDSPTLEKEGEGRLRAGLPREVRMCAGPVFGSMVDCGISSDMTRHRNVMANVTDAWHFREVCATGVRGRTKVTGGGGGKA